MSKKSVVKATLSTGKVVYLREMKISDTELAAQACARKAGDSDSLLKIMMQKELVKILLVQIGDKKISAAEKEDIDALFNITEYSQVLTVVGKMSGSDDMGKQPVLEHMTE